MAMSFPASFILIILPRLHPVSSAIGAGLPSGPVALDPVCVVMVPLQWDVHTPTEDAIFCYIASCIASTRIQARISS